MLKLQYIKYLSIHYIETIVVVAIVLLTLSVFASGYIYRNDIAYLLKQGKAMDYDSRQEVVKLLRFLMLLCMY